MKKFFIYLLSIILIFSIFLGAGYYWFQSKNKVKEGVVNVFPGASVKQVGEILKNAGLIENEDAFYYYIKGKNYYYTKIKKDNKTFVINFKSGKYKIKKGDFDNVISQLNDGKGIITNNLVIPEGSTVPKIAKILVEKDIAKTTEEIINYWNNADQYTIWKQKYPWLPERKEGVKNLLEGYLLANTYHLEENETLEMITDKLLNETGKWVEIYQNEYNPKVFTFDQIITLASIVEAESKFPQDRPKVAKVFLNRLAKGIPLQSDMTVAYGNGEHKVFMYNKDIEKESPYNTYKVGALPIGPISSPSLSAFKGAIQPDSTLPEALFFYARPNGETFYSNTAQEHENYRLQYEKEWKELENKK